eukprot:s864_g16.t1
MIILSQQSARGHAWPSSSRSSFRISSWIFLPASARSWRPSPPGLGVKWSEAVQRQVFVASRATGKVEPSVLFSASRMTQSSPLGAYALPDAKLRAACVAPLTGAVYKGSSSIRKPTLAVVFSDWRISIFPNGPRVDLARPPGIPAEEVPAFVRSAAPHPGHGCVGVVLVVGTQTGLLFSLFLTQEAGSTFKAEAGKLWPTVSEHCLYNFFKRVRRFRTGADVSQDRPLQEETPFLAQKVETVSASSSSSLFATLAWNQEQLAYYTHPRWVGAADLAWTVSLAQLVAGDPSTKLLSVCHGGKNDACDDSILVLYRGKDTAGSEASLLARLAWPARTSPVQSSCQHGEVVGPPSPVNGPAFVVAFGDIVVSAMKVEGGDRFAICMTGMAAQRLQAGVSQIVDYGILGLSLLPEGISSGHVQVLTPHGLLSCPQDMTSVGKETDGQLPSTADAFIQMAYDLFDAGQEEQAVSISVRAFSQVGAQPMLLAVEQRTRKLLDADTSPKRTASEPLDIRQMLITKARSLEHWLQFLQKVGIWIRMGSAPNITSAQQNVVEACERAAAAMRLVEYHDTASDVFASAIHNALDRGTVQEAEDEKRSFFNCLSSCERLLGSLAEYPRTLPLAELEIRRSLRCRYGDNRAAPREPFDANSALLDLSGEGGRPKYAQIAGFPEPSPMLGWETPVTTRRFRSVLVEKRTCGETEGP